jgi:hypothetical protein
MKFNFRQEGSGLGDLSRLMKFAQLACYLARYF